MTKNTKTYADKYLKDGVSEYDFLNFVFNEGNIGWNGEEDYCYIKKLDLLHLLQQPLKPTLTEDEKVILRNLPTKYEFIGRNNHSTLQLSKISKIKEDCYCDEEIDELYNHLFQFIKPGEEYSIKELLGEMENE